MFVPISPFSKNPIYGRRSTFSERKSTDIRVYYTEFSDITVIYYVIYGCDTISMLWGNI